MMCALNHNGLIGSKGQFPESWPDDSRAQTIGRDLLAPALALNAILGEPE